MQKSFLNKHDPQMHINYVISLTSAYQRREHIQKEFSQQNIPFEFFDALKPSKELTSLMEKFIPNLLHAKLTEGEKACFMSHYMLWQKCLSEDLPYIYIFEDDVLLGENANKFLAEDEWLEERFKQTDKFILRFETFLNFSKCKDKKIKPYSGRKILKLVSENCGSAGYVISREAVKQLNAHICSLTSNHLLAIDLLMFNIFNQFTYQVSPGVCVQEGSLYPKDTKLHSQLGTERQKYLSVKKKRTLKTVLISLAGKPKKILRKIYRKL
ncbi:TPA: glycosyltransferase family 25 protein, partial [Haemophilus influenzae]